MANGDYEALARRVSDLGTKMDAINSTVATTKNLARVLTIVLIAAALFGVYTLLKPLLQAYEKPEPYLKALKTEVEERIMPKIQSELKESVTKTGQEVAGLVIKKIESRQQDVVRAVDEESQAFLVSMQKFAQDELQTRLEHLNNKVYTKIVQEIPDLKSPETAEKVVGNAQTAMEGAVRRFSEEHLSTHFSAIANIETLLVNFPVSESVKKMSDVELQEALIATLGVYGTNVLKHSLPAESKQYLKNLAE